MAEPITVRLNDELHAKISSYAEQKSYSHFSILMEKPNHLSRKGAERKGNR